MGTLLKEWWNIDLEKRGIDGLLGPDKFSYPKKHMYVFFPAIAYIEHITLRWGVDIIMVWFFSLRYLGRERDFLKRYEWLKMTKSRKTAREQKKNWQQESEGTLDPLKN